MDPRDWDSHHRSYWGKLAGSYDELYVSPWCAYEDRQLEGWLTQFFSPAHGRVLDLACGTGLGLELARRTNSSLDYVGLDISFEMLERLREKHAFDNLCCSPMDDLSMFVAGEFDYVICLNSAFSLADDPKAVLDEIRRVVKPGGGLFLSALNRWALRRVLRGIRGTREMFATRNAHSGFGTVPAITYTAAELTEHVAAAGFQTLRVHPQGVLAGVLERFNLRRLDTALLKIAPNLAHSLNVVATKLQ